MNDKQWKRVQTLFKEIVDLDPDTRFERMESVKTEDPLLYEELRSLLAADSQDTSLLDGFAIEQVDLSDLVPLEGVQVGPFRMKSRLGQVVWAVSIWRSAWKADSIKLWLLN